jgi:hypothetical protein
MSQSPFYQGKSVKIVVAATPGGTGDFRRANGVELS